MTPQQRDLKRAKDGEYYKKKGEKIQYIKKITDRFKNKYEKIKGIWGKKVRWLIKSIEVLQIETTKAIMFRVHPEKYYENNLSTKIEPKQADHWKSNVL